ncbi:MAG: Ni/Fe hydrogenase subunit alpha [Armatimonadota bacterium]|nr:Ni/Fe hydrogenase subunit alpha [Armatimonadota bacterium]MDR7486482.1 Ni/Fe hydrogenase subunit alpha [Armatimonadota bacterium]MDR7532248.1 Ni/Fe hydrogenase subunit alpha [Armatimonadota bacterium]MDR7537177.1 Ni/Fe hydrogenase subunit alpha [Armatimonadota bacterium]
MATRRIVIDPVTRIEGHARISVHLDETGRVRAARFHVTEFRGFEKFCEGRLFWEMPAITARVCGICPVSHLIASAKAGDALLAVAIPPAAERLRRLMHLAQIVQSHALSFFHLASPDLLLGFDAPPEERNLFGLIARHPDLARAGIRLRQYGQEIIELLGGRRIHPAWVTPGGVAAPLRPEHRERMLAGWPEALRLARAALDRFKGTLDAHAEEAAVFGTFPSLFAGLVDADGHIDYYDGRVRFVGPDGVAVADGLDPTQYWEYLGEAIEPWSYLKFPYYLPWGYPDGAYRVGPLARLNVAAACGTPLADAELAEYRQRTGRVALSSFYYHYARLIEIVHALEQVGRLLDDPVILDRDVRARAGRNRHVGVGAAEAPRGTLYHHYEVDDDGRLVRVNLIIATGQNNLAMNRAVAQVATHYITGDDVREGVLNRLEAAIRAFDPCLSCSTHAAGTMPLVVDIIAADGRPLRQLRRDAVEAGR